MVFPPGGFQMDYAGSLLLTALLLLLSVVVQQNLAEGSGVQVLYRWVLTHDFAQNDDGVLTVTVRYLYPNGTYQDFVSTPTVTCAPKGAGTVTVANGKATF